MDPRYRCALTMEHSQEIIPVRPWQALAGPKTRALATVFRKGVAPWTSGHTCVHRLRPGAVSRAPESHPKRSHPTLGTPGARYGPPPGHPGAPLALLGGGLNGHTTHLSRAPLGGLALRRGGGQGRGRPPPFDVAKIVRRFRRTLGNG